MTCPKWCIIQPNKRKVALMEDVELESVEKHEMWHMKQAYEFCKRHGYVITRENYDGYLHVLSADCKKGLKKKV